MTAWPMDRDLQRVIILGAGAVGGAMGALLHQSGVDVALLARGDHARVMGHRGLRLVVPEGPACVSVPVYEELPKIAFRPGDVAVLASKLYDAEALLEGLRQQAGPDVPVICAVNGVAAEDWAAERFARVVPMMVWLPATFLVPGEVRLHTSAQCRGVLDVGALSPEAAPVAQALARALVRAGFDSVLRQDIQRWKAAKWITNLGGTAQALMVAENEEQRAHVVRRVQEAAQAEGRRVLDRAGVDRVPHDEFLSRVRLVSEAPIEGLTREGGSTWQSRRRGRPLETPWLEGAVALLAQRFRVPAPVNTALARAAADGRVLTASEVPLAQE